MTPLTEMEDKTARITWTLLFEGRTQSIGFAVKCDCYSSYKYNNEFLRVQIPNYYKSPMKLDQFSK